MSFRIEGTSITLTRGDSFYGIVGMERDGEAYEPQEGDIIRFSLKRNIMTQDRTAFLDKKPLVQKEIPSDTMILHLAPEDTKNLPFGRYVYDIEIQFANGDVDTFISNASLELTKEVG